MAEVLILEFAGVTLAAYQAVSRELGIDPETGEGDWPDGLLVHSAAIGPNGLVVHEVWESRDAQRTFMRSRLSKALQAGGITAMPSRLEWDELAGLHVAG
jgi:hypothetical protein